MLKFFFIALVVAFSAYAARIGLVLAALSIKELFLTLSGYTLLFSFTFLFKGIINDSRVLNLAGYGGYLHFTVAIGLLVWSVIGWKAENRRISTYFLLLPCPFCMLTVFFSVFAASSLLDVPFYLVVVGAYGVFASLIVLFFVLGRLLKIDVWEVMFVASVYYIVLLLSARYYRETLSVYRMALNWSYGLPEGALGLLLAVFAVVALGVLRGRRSYG